MAYHHHHNMTTTTTTNDDTARKRKHLFDEEVQFYADEEDYWKKPRITNNADNAAIMGDDATMTIMQDEQAAGDVSSTRTEGSLSPAQITTIDDDDVGDNVGDNDCGMQVDVDDNETTASTHQKTSEQPLSNAQNNNNNESSSWAMLSLKELRRQAPEKSLEARRDMMRLWRHSSSVNHNRVDG